MDVTPERARKLAPIRLLQRDGKMHAELCLVPARFDQPFFDQTVLGRIARPLHQLCRWQVPLDALPAPELPVAGLIFHMSRCGSTLVSQMLTRLPENVVVSEPGVLDMALEARAASDEERIGWLRTLVGSLARVRAGGERRVFLKMTAWSAFSLPLLRRAWPEARHVFVYRDPLEVLVSNVNHLGARMMPGALPPAWLGLDPRELYTLSLEEYAAILVARICQAALRDFAGRWVHYRELPGVVPSLFGLPADPRMDAAATQNAKRPEEPFVDDRAAKQRQATPELRALVDKWLAEPYAQMQAAQADRRLTT